MAPEHMREQMYERFYKNHLAFLAMHPVANFVVQAVLATVNKSPQVVFGKPGLHSDFWCCLSVILLPDKRG